MAVIRMLMLVRVHQPTHIYTYYTHTQPLHSTHSRPLACTTAASQFGQAKSVQDSWTVLVGRDVDQFVPPLMTQKTAHTAKYDTRSGYI
jgi:hypothetical protein